jgi:hypothetical protein
MFENASGTFAELLASIEAIMPPTDFCHDVHDILVQYDTAGEAIPLYQLIQFVQTCGMGG